MDQADHSDLSTHIDTGPSFTPFLLCLPSCLLLSIHNIIILIYTPYQLCIQILLIACHFPSIALCVELVDK